MARARRAAGGLGDALRLGSGARAGGGRLFLFPHSRSRPGHKTPVRHPAADIQVSRPRPPPNATRLPFRHGNGPRRPDTGTYTRAVIPYSKLDRPWLVPAWANCPTRRDRALTAFWTVFAAGAGPAS